jgi:hypothetical protein
MFSAFVPSKSIQEKNTLGAINRLQTGNEMQPRLSYLSVYREVNKIIVIQFFIIYVPSQQLQGQLQTQHIVYK